MSVFTETLAIEVGVSGVEKVQQALDKVIGEIEAAEAAVASLRSGLLILGTVAGLAFGGIREAMEQQTMEANLLGLNESLEMTAQQMEMIDKIASKGIFSEEQAYNAIRNLNKFGASVEDNIDLVEKLGARSGSIENAAALIGQLEQGMTSNIGRRLREFGIGPEKLRAAGLQMDGQQVKGTSEEIIAALKKIEDGDKLIQNLQKTLGASTGALVYQFKELVETLGTPLVGPVTWLVDRVKGLFEIMKDLNVATRGVAGSFMMIVGTLIGLGKIVEAMKALELATKLTAFWTGIQTALLSGWNVLVGIVRALIAVFQTLTNATKLQAVWTAIVDALMGNWVALAAGIAVAAALGIAWGLTGGFGGNGEEVKPKRSEPAASRPVRRDDIERIHKKMQGRMWNG